MKKKAVEKDVDLLLIDSGGEQPNFFLGTGSDLFSLPAFDELKLTPSLWTCKIFTTETDCQTVRSLWERRTESRAPRSLPR